VSWLFSLFVLPPSLPLSSLRPLQVPLAQALEWASVVRARGVPVEILAFPDDRHSLESPRAQASALEAATRFLVARLLAPDAAP